MIYNDFQILNDEKYKLMNEHFTKSKLNDRQVTLTEICHDLIVCRDTCLHISSKFNVKLRKAVEETNNVITKTFDNFSSLFNINIKPNTKTSNFNLFSFMKRLIDTTRKITEWGKVETKEYYISIAQKSLGDILNCFDLILSALEESNLYFFKYM